MPKAILTCGKVCSGKTTLAKKLKAERNAVILSCDELMLSLFDEQLGEKHNETVRKSEEYLLKKSLEILECGIDVILDWGFWTKRERDFAKEFYGSRGIEYEFHYIIISDEEWYRRLDKRIMMFWKKSLMRIMLMKDWLKNSNRFLKFRGKKKLMFGVNSKR